MASVTLTACQGETFHRHKKQGNSLNGVVMGSEKTWFLWSFNLLIYARASGNTEVIGRTTNYLNNLGLVSEDYSLHPKTFFGEEKQQYK